MDAASIHAAADARPQAQSGGVPTSADFTPLSSYDWNAPATWGTATYAASKHLPADYLRDTWGVHDAIWNGQQAVIIPWRDAQGVTFRERVRLAPDENGKKQERWGQVGVAYTDAEGRGFKHYEGATKGVDNALLPPYGCDHVAPDTPYVIVGEGESDAQACHLMGIPFLGVAGASCYTATVERFVSNYLASPPLYVMDEGDQGAKTLHESVAKLHGTDFKLISCKGVTFPDGTPCKDPSDVLLASDSVEQATERMTAILAQAVPYGIDTTKDRFELGGITGMSGADAIRHGIEDGEPPALIKGVLAEGGKLVISAPSKNFKSWAALELGVMCATGDSWMGHRCKPSRVVYLDYENGQRTTSNRLARVGRALLSRDGHRTIDPDLLRMVGDNLTVFDMLGEGTDTDELTANVIEYIRRMDATGHHVDLLIIDPIYKASDADENDNAEIQKALRPFDSVRKLGTATCYTAHFKKGWRSCPVEERISGAGSFVRDYTAGVFLSPEADGRGSMTDAAIGQWVAAHEGAQSMYDTVEHARKSEIRGYQVTFDTRDYRAPKDGTCYVEGIREGMPHHVMVPDALTESTPLELDSNQTAADAKREQAKASWQIINAEIEQAVRETCTTDEGGNVTRWPTAGEVYDRMDWANVMESTGRAQPDESHFRDARWLKCAFCAFVLDESTGRGRKATVKPRVGNQTPQGRDS